MQRELPANGDRSMRSAVSPMAFMSPDPGISTPSYLSNGVDCFSFRPSILSPKEAISITPSTLSFDNDEDDHLFIPRLALEFQETIDRYDLCASHLHDAAKEAEALRHENSQLRIANAELASRLAVLSMTRDGRFPPPEEAIADEIRRLRLGEAAPSESSPRSVLGKQSGPFAGRSAAAERIPLPKSISIRSARYLKPKPTGSTGPVSNRNGPIRSPSPVVIGTKVSSACGGSKGEEEEEELEVAAYNQGMLKTELCSKWEETGECRYGDGCQFAHGVGELRPVIRHPRYKTEACHMVRAAGNCSYGHRCHFRHALAPHERLLLGPN